MAKKNPNTTKNPSRTVAKKPNTIDKIVAAAEKRMRAGGFHGFSFREIADDVGIKSASVHHHFPTKENLAVAVVRAYSDREIGVLGDPADEERGPNQLMSSYVDLFRSALVDDHSMCLCGLLASEAANVPQTVNAEVQRFFNLNLEWVETVIRRAIPKARSRDIKDKALMITATLEGALLGSNCHGDIDLFENIVRELNKTLSFPKTKKN